MMFTMQTALFVTHKKKRCGVYEFGAQVFQAIAGSAKYKFVKAECDSLPELLQSIERHRPDVIIYNYHPSVMPWLCTRVTKGVYRNAIAGLKPLQIGVIHEVTQEVADTATAYRNSFVLGSSNKKLNSLFDFYIAPDPTLLLKNPLVFKTGRLVPEFSASVPPPSVFTVGSFGFATPKKGFEKIVQKVQEEFDQAVIRLNMPPADFGDKDGVRARASAERCREIIHKKGIRLEVSHDFFNEEQLLKFLAGNSMNVFMYEDAGGRGISSAVDNALAVKRPVAVTRCSMFRHILSARPTVCVDDSSLRQIYDNGFAPLEKIAQHWDKAHLVWDYERILDLALKKSMPPAKKKTLVQKLKSFRNKILTLPDHSFTWLRNTEAAAEDDLSVSIPAEYIPVPLEKEKGLNRILDDAARKLYEPAVEKLFECVPLTMAKKLSRANVQQAFVFDTVYRLLKDFEKPRLLCVGSYEDTASMTLQKMGFAVDEVDPMINFSVQEFYTRPSTVQQSYSIIFSTSVIEHDPDDASFMKCINDLLAPDGYAVITCDYKDGWKLGDSKPGVDARLYTKDDLKKRLLSYAPDCALVDAPDWNCPDPDFLYLEKYRYTFATFVVQKKKG